MLLHRLGQVFICNTVKRIEKTQRISFEKEELPEKELPEEVLVFQKKYLGFLSDEKVLERNNVYLLLIQGINHPCDTEEWKLSNNLYYKFIEEANNYIDRHAGECSDITIKDFV